LLALVEFKETLNVPSLPEEETGAYETVGGFVLSRLGHVPAVGDHFEWGGWRFEVVDMDGRRIDRILATPAGKPGATQPEEKKA
jgi:putative hemolysin